MKFRYKCKECGMGHDGFVASVDDVGFTNVGDFCSFKCFQKYLLNHGYSLRQRITDEKDECIVCGKEHDAKLINPKEQFMTRSFCSKKCLKKAKETILPKIKDKEYKKGFSEFLDTFSKADDKIKKSISVTSLNVDKKELESYLK